MLDYCFFIAFLGSFIFIVVSDPELFARINCQVVNGSYIYLSHLLELEKCLPY